MKPAKPKETDDDRDQSWENGNRAAWSRMLGECIRRLGYKGRDKASWIAEREDAIAALRGICEAHGDNDWNATLCLADIIEKHLGNYFE